MQSVFSLLTVLILSYSLKSQNIPNPYVSIGKSAPKVATLTNGAYDEFFIKDSLVLINNYAISRKTGDIVFSKDEHPEIIAQLVKNEEDKFRFLSTDPLTKTFPMLTPYQFASNTPISAIDLDGLEEYNVTKTYAYNSSTGKVKLTVTVTYNATYYPGGSNNQRRESSPGAGDQDRKADIRINGNVSIHQNWPTSYGFIPSVERTNVPVVNDQGSIQNLPLKDGKGMKLADPRFGGNRFKEMRGYTEFDKSTNLLYNTNLSFGAVAQDALDTYVDALLSNPELSATITGNTSRLGSAANNLTLSVNRANDVLQQIITIAQGKEGVTPEQISNLRSRITVVGNGESASTNADGTDESEDRNVKFEINLPAGTQQTN